MRWRSCIAYPKQDGSSARSLSPCGSVRAPAVMLLGLSLSSSYQSRRSSGEWQILNVHRCLLNRQVEHSNEESLARSALLKGISVKVKDIVSAKKPADMKLVLSDWHAVSYGKRSTRSSSQAQHWTSTSQSRGTAVTLLDYCLLTGLVASA